MPGPRWPAPRPGRRPGPPHPRTAGLACSHLPTRLGAGLLGRRHRRRGSGIECAGLRGDGGGELARDQALLGLHGVLGARGLVQSGGLLGLVGLVLGLLLAQRRLLALQRVLRALELVRAVSMFPVAMESYSLADCTSSALPSNNAASAPVNSPPFMYDVMAS